MIHPEGVAIEDPVVIQSKGSEDVPVEKISAAKLLPGAVNEHARSGKIGPALYEFSKTPDPVFNRLLYLADRMLPLAVVELRRSSGKAALSACLLSPNFMWPPTVFDGLYSGSVGE